MQEPPFCQGIMGYFPALLGRIWCMRLPSDRLRIASLLPLRPRRTLLIRKSFGKNMMSPINFAYSRLHLTCGC